MALASLRSIVAVVVLAASLSSLAPAALAGGLDEKGKATLKQATRFFKQGMYDEAAKMLTDLSVDHPEMVILQRHLGACYYYLRRPEPALSNLRSYLARKKSDIAADDKQEVERWIDEMEKLRAKTAAEAAAPQPVVESPAPAPLPPPAPMVPPSPVAGSPAYAPAPMPQPVAATPPAPRAPAAPPQEDPGMPIQEKLGIAAGVAGLAGLGVCIFEYFNAKDHLDNANRLGCNSKDCVGPGQSEYNDSQNALTVSNVTGIAGGVFLLGGIVLILTTPSPAPNNVALVPLVGRDSAQLALTGRF
jgi:hypothetical protein